MTNNLGRNELTANQEQKEVTINESDGILDAKLTEPLTLDFTSGDIVLTAAQWTQQAAYICTNVVAPRSLTTPQSKGYAFVDNTGGANAVTVTRGTATVVVPNGEGRLVYQDGTANGLQNAGGGGGGGAGSISLQDEGVGVANTPHSILDFVGAGVTVADVNGSRATIAIPGGSGITLKDEGSNVTNTPHSTLNFTGDGVTVSDVDGTEATVDITGGGGTVLNVGADFLVKSQTFSAANPVNVTDLNVVDGETYYAVLETKVSVDDTEIRMRVSRDNGATFRTANYNYVLLYENSNDPSPATKTIKAAHADQGAFISLTANATNEGVGFDAAENATFVIELGQLGTDGTYKQIHWRGSYNDFGGHTVGLSGSGAHRLDVGTDASGDDPINAIQFFPDSGNMTGRISIYRRTITENKVGVSHYGGDILVESQDVSNVAQVDFTNINPQPGETFYLVYNITVGTDGAYPSIRFSTDNGTTFDSTSTYAWSSRRYASNLPNPTDPSDGGNANNEILIGSDNSGWGIGNVSNENSNGIVEFSELAKVGVYKGLIYTVRYTGTDASNIYTDGSGLWRGSTAVVNAFRFRINTGTMSGRLSLYKRSPEASPFNQTLHAQDQKASGTNGGSATAGSTVTRDLNTVVKNTIAGASLSSNAITLPAGNYRITAHAPALDAARHRTRWRNTTDNTTVLLGSSGFSNQSSNEQNLSLIQGEFTITAQKTFELQHYVQAQATVAGETLGANAGSGENEVYADVMIQRLP